MRKEKEIEKFRRLRKEIRDEKDERENIKKFILFENKEIFNI